jgi:hypothetical protein
MPFVHECGCVTEGGTEYYMLRDEQVMCEIAARYLVYGFSRSKRDDLKAESFFREHLANSKEPVGVDTWQERLRLHCRILSSDKRWSSDERDHIALDAMMCEYISRVVDGVDTPTDEFRSLGRILLAVYQERRRNFMYA